VAQRHAKLFEVEIGKLGQNLRVDFALAERDLILTEAQGSEPLPDIHMDRPH
jgi:hypothetical protein